MIQKRVVLKSAVVLVVIILTINSVLFIKNGNSTKHIEKPHFVMGILSGLGNRDLRDAQRATWLSTIRARKSEIPFRITYKYLLDYPTNETILEDEIYQDIFYLNATRIGRVIKFGEKLYKWFKYINDEHPDAVIGGKLDDDAFLCLPQLFWRINSLLSPTLYYGWQHGTGRNININTRMDEMFVVLGRKLIERIAGREYCYGKQCDINHHLIDTDYGGTSVGAWLSVYNDLDIRGDNSKIFHKGRNDVKSIPNYVNENTCKKYVVFHKSSVRIMHQLHQYNSRNITTIT